MHRTGVDARAIELFEQGITGDVWLKAHGRLLPAIAIHTPQGTLHGWFVPVVVDDTLAAFMQFDRAERLERFSTFMRAAGDLRGCPHRAGWVDPASVRRIASNRLHPGETLGEPFLTYDRYPDRLVWAVPVASDRGPLGYIYVAGDYVYTSTGDESAGS